MARFDALGMFWEDIAPPKPPKKEKPKAVPPEPIWLLPTYLPGLHEARAMKIDLLSDNDIVEASRSGERFTFDIESYPNYTLIGFKSISTAKVWYVEIIGEDNSLSYTDCLKLKWVLTNLTTIGFFSKGYDMTIAAIACAGNPCSKIYLATKMLIEGINGLPPTKPYQVLRSFKVSKLEGDHIDLIELVKLRPSLKICAGRLHAKRMQDLPFAPGTILTNDQITITRWYWVNDLDNTALLYKEVKPQIDLREQIGKKYGIDVRSRSDAQIAEDLLSAQIKKRTGQRFLSKNEVEPGTVYKYRVPAFIKYQSELLNYVLNEVVRADFVVAKSGKVIMPPNLKALRINMNESTYQMGIGGLHSTEKNVCHIADENYFVKDRDVTSYYPRIIINQGLKPENLGQNFTIEYTIVVNERVAAKERGDTVTADTLKIVANGSFGKFGSKYSILYSPQLLIQTTLTGQLSLLMLIERLELAGFTVVSANTDGIVTKGLRTRISEFEAIVKQWELETNFQTEETDYKAVYSRDINNYVAIYSTPQKGKRFKGKGIFGNVKLDKNPTTLICYEAAIATLLDGSDYKQIIRDCRDITKFTSMRTVRGGAYKDGVFLGKAVRWYYANEVEGVIVYAKSGNKVHRTDGAKPLMTLPDDFPMDVCYEWYENETTKLLIQIGYLTGELDVDEEDDEDEEDDQSDDITIDE